ncbi:MAG: peptidoglycan-binding domain-containing protein [Acetivibrionales bacterium]|jgi:peptidoglycan hydrolase-like protein with peptidoglycan-binding domain
MNKKRITCAVAIVVFIVLAAGYTSVFASSPVLRHGSRGSEVTALQKDLVKLGYLSVDPTGYYGDLTEAAVKKLQKDYGCEVDGIAGKITLSLIDRLRGRTSSSTGNAGLLREGDENNHVTALQKDLIKLGYLKTKATGYYGPATKAAVISLQKKYGLEVDGIAGSATLGLISRLISEMNAAGDKKATASAAESGKEAEATATATAAVKEAADDSGKSEKKTKDDYLLNWYGNVEKILARGDTATVYDIKTGKTFKIKRTYGTNHADCETLTKEDTAIMKAIYNGTWSWERRPVIVIVDDVKIAACMTGYPHAGVDKYAANKTVNSRSGGYGRGTNLDAVKGNNMDGVFDIHFLGSKNHYNNKIDPKHQALVKEAAEWAAANNF